MIALGIGSCKKNNQTNAETRVQIEINTTKGTILVELYNETPKHRDNFIKLVNDGFYDSILWHRVINDFIIQTGDQTSIDAKPERKIGAIDVGYLVPSEIIDTLFHKRGTLSAAHDGNPDLYSSGSHFVITQKGPIADSLFKRMEDRINRRLAVYNTYHADSNASIYNATLKAYKEQNEELYKRLSDSVKSMANKLDTPVFFRFPKEHKEYYMKYGGVPFNDRIYTVFGEVVTGMDVVDSIAATKTDKNDRPIEDVRIISMRIVNDTNKH